MSHDKIGPREQQLREMRERRFAERNAKKPSVADLRSKVAKVKPMARNQGGKRGR